MAVKKQWYEIVTPKAFGAAVVAETLAADPKQLIGRTINVSLMEISRDYSKFYVKLKLQVDNVEGNKAMTKFVGHNVMYERIYRMIQRHMRRVDVIYDTKTKDDKNMRIKVVFVMLKRVNSSIKSAARKVVNELIDKVAKENDMEKFVNIMITGELQKMIKKDVSKIYPVGNVEIRKSELQEIRQKLAA